MEAKRVLLLNQNPWHQLLLITIKDAKAVQVQKDLAASYLLSMKCTLRNAQGKLNFLVKNFPFRSSCSLSVTV